MRPVNDDLCAGKANYHKYTDFRFVNVAFIYNAMKSEKKNKIKENYRQMDESMLWHKVVIRSGGLVIGYNSIYI